MLLKGHHVSSSNIGVRALLTGLSATHPQIELGGGIYAYHLTSKMFPNDVTCIALKEVDFGYHISFGDVAMGALIRCSPNIEKLILDKHKGLFDHFKKEGNLSPIKGLYVAPQASKYS